ncbi:MAG: inositol monophosphatase family protein [Nanoarchaeota archaeon]
MRDTIRLAALAAGKIMLENYEKEFSVSQKTPKDRVTAVDIACEKKIISMIQKKFPKHTIISEERGTIDRKSSFTWYIDPIDGTTNYSRGIPLAGVSIALVKDRKPVLGAICDPFRDELFFAEKGKGAFLNSKRMHVSRINTLKDAIVDFDFRNEDIETRMRISRNLLTACYGTRKISTQALGLAYLACGRIDGYLHPLTSPHDFAAGWLIVEEAGGKASDFQGKPLPLKKTSILATNGLLHDKLLDLIRA